MKKSGIVVLAMLFCLGAGFAAAQQTQAPAPAPAAPAPAAPAAQAPAPATPAQAAPAPAATPSLSITRMEIAGGVENRQPTGIAASFPASTEKVFCYLEFQNVPKDSTITYVWTLGPNEMAKVTQPIKKSWRWRTWSNKTLGGMKGDWKVAVLDENGTELKSATFKVE